MQLYVLTRCSYIPAVFWLKIQVRLRAAEHASTFICDVGYTAARGHFLRWCMFDSFTERSYDVCIRSIGIQPGQSQTLKKEVAVNDATIPPSSGDASRKPSTSPDFTC